MKHKSYANKKGISAKELIARVESYINEKFNLEIEHLKYPDSNGEYSILAITKHDVAQRMIGQDKHFSVCIKESAGNIDVRIGLGSWMSRTILIVAAAVVSPALVPVATGAGVVGAKTQSEIMQSVWKYIDFCMDA